MSLPESIRTWITRPKVRPWALAAPVMVLLVAAFFLRPLRHPTSAGEDELARLATIRAIVERHTLATLPGEVPASRAVTVAGQTFADQPPMMSLLLAGPYWALRRAGVSFESNPTLVVYFLTVLGTTLPAALAAGFVYRMGRLFELSRPARAALAYCSVAATGGLSYAVVLNPYVPAAALVLGSMTSLVQVITARRPYRAGGWLGLAGFSVSLAAAIDPAAILFVVPFLFVVPAVAFFPSIGVDDFRTRAAVKIANTALKIGGALLFGIGTLPPLVVHLAAQSRSTGSVWPVQLVRELTGRSAPAATVSVVRADTKAATRAVVTVAADSSDDDVTDLANPSPFLRSTGRVGELLFGDHGLLSHFPVLLVALFGIAGVTLRHWPLATKVLAAGTLLAAVAVVVVAASSSLDFTQAAFSNRWLVTISPPLFAWAAVFLRRPHGAVVWTVAGTLLAYSLIVGVIGMSDPIPGTPFGGFTALELILRK